MPPRYREGIMYINELHIETVPCSLSPNYPLRFGFIKSRAKFSVVK